MNRELDKCRVNVLFNSLHFLFPSHAIQSRIDMFRMRI